MKYGELWCFNSTLVRLKEVNRLFSRVQANASFQFHTGSIKRQKRKQTRNRHLPRFNSTLVRLKGRKTSYGLIRILLFQFHTGSIKSIRRVLRGCRRGRCFNSTLVRLKVAHATASDGETGFNSTLVRLKVQCAAHQG